MDRLSAMAVFVKAAELGSFSAAADALQMSPQLVGKQVQQLEAHLGVQLLQRTTRRQSLTDVGASFYERAKSILAEMDAAENLAAEALATPVGTLRVNAPVSFGSHTLAQALPAYLGAFPQVRLELTLNNRVVDLVDDGYDAVFRIGHLPDSSLIARRLRPFRLVACASRGYLAGRAPIEVPSDLQDHVCLGFAHPDFRTHWPFDGPGGRVLAPVFGPMSADHAEPLLAAGLSGLGIMLLPSDVVAQALEDGRLIQILPDYSPPTYPMHLLYNRDRSLTPKLRSFIDFAISQFGASDP